MTKKRHLLTLSLVEPSGGNGVQCKDISICAQIALYAGSIPAATSCLAGTIFLSLFFAFGARSARAL